MINHLGKLITYISNEWNIALAVQQTTNKEEQCLSALQYPTFYDGLNSKELGKKCSKFFQVTATEDIYKSTVSSH